MLNNKQKILALLFLLLALLPFGIQSDYYLGLIIMIMMWTVMGMSWNLLGGYAGQVSFGHALFFGIGAYTSCLVHIKLGVSLWIGLLFAGLAGAIISIPIGLICFRLRGPYFALSVLAFAEVMRLLTLHWKSFTEGAVGILLIFPVVDTKVGFFYLILALLLLTIGVIYYLVRTKAGYYFLAIREDENAAEALGIHLVRYKLLALIVSAFFTGVVGSFYANYTNFIDPYIAFSIVDVSIAVVLMVALGGIGTFWGPAIGAAVVVLLSEFLRTAFAEVHVLVYGLLIILVILFMPQGIAGGAGDLYAKLKKKKEVEAKEQPDAA